MKIIITQLNKIEKNITKKLSKQLEKSFQSVVETVQIGKELKIPDSAYNPDRDQYNASNILRHMKSKSHTDYDKIFGITEKDLYTSSLNFVFGQAEASGNYALISIHRLKPKFYEEEENRELLRERIAKEAIHELGHTFGLKHCENPRCVMSFSNSIRDVDHKKARFCEECEKKLLQAT